MSNAPPSRSLLAATLWLAEVSGCSPPHVPYEPRTFLGYACEDDCGRHKAGFAWAEDRRAANVAACTALPPRDSEGCRAYVEERLTPGQAGERWAIENEITVPRACDGAGDAFRHGCRQALVPTGGPRR